MILIVSGPGYAGKSTFIADRGRGVIDFPPNAEVEYLAPFIRSGRKPYSGMVLHYNIGNSRAAVARSGLESLKKAAPGDEFSAVVLVTPETELRERIFFDGGATGRSVERIAAAREHFASPGTLHGIYEAWLQALEGAGIEYKLVSSTGGTFSEISRERLAEVVAEQSTATKTPYSYAEIASFLHDEALHRYHRVELPYGLHTRGQDVWQRFPMMFPRDLRGWSALDIGCAHGAFSFEAERRGAKVVASDINKERLSGAARLGEILGSSVRFSATNYLDPRLRRNETKKHDLVLALNVLHHVPDPTEALTSLSAMARRCVVLEFPTSRDPLYQNKPMRQNVGPQLVEALSLFKEVRMRPSPKEGRVIAVCYTEEPRDGSNERSFVERGGRRGTPRHERRSLSSADASSGSCPNEVRSAGSFFRQALDRFKLAFKG